MSVGLRFLVVLPVQEGFQAAFRSIQRFNGDASLSTWLITLNTALMQLRSRAKRPQEAIDEPRPHLD